MAATVIVASASTIRRVPANPLAFVRENLLVTAPIRDSLPYGPPWSCGFEAIRALAAAQLGRFGSARRQPPAD